MRRDRSVRTHSRSLRPGFRMVKIAISRPEPAPATLNNTRWSIAVSRKQSDSLREHVIDPPAVGIQRGGIGVAGDEHSRAIAKLRPGGQGKSAEQRLYCRGRILARSQVGHVGVGDLGLSHSHTLVRTEEEYFAPQNW